MELRRAKNFKKSTPKHIFHELLRKYFKIHLQTYR